MTTYEVTYAHRTANDNEMLYRHKHLTLDEADHLCREVEMIDGYRLVDVSAEIDDEVLEDDIH